jgi:hypothetical protein
MSNAELIEMINLLNPEDYNFVVTLVSRLDQNTYSLSKKSEDELAHELALSIEESDQGLTHSARQVSEAMRKKYAV